MSKSKYDNLEPIGFCYLGMFGVNVYEIQYGINDYVIAGWDDFTNTRRRKVHYDKEGEPYFNIGGIKVYFNEVMRLNN